MPEPTLLTVIGARPQFIKAAPVSAAFAREGSVREVVVHTGQHYDANMSGVFFEELGIREPDHHLGAGGGSHGVQTARMLEGLEALCMSIRPRVVLVYGDTNSTLAGALAAAKLHISVAHVEAGLRSFNRRMPEEINRVLTDHLSAIRFAPTQAAIANLAAEGIVGESVVKIGDVMLDAAVMFAPRTRARASIVATLGVEEHGYVLATVHRQENTDDGARLGVILEALADVAGDIRVVLPLHPRTRAAIDRAGLGDAAARLDIVDPLGYLDMLRLEQGAGLVVTDSGGVQKEAYFARRPCVTLRDETEWIELVDAGWNRLVPPREATEVAAAIRAALAAPLPAAAPAFYGTGEAATEIVAHLVRAIA